MIGVLFVLAFYTMINIKGKVPVKEIKLKWILLMLVHAACSWVFLIITLFMIAWEEL